MNLKHRQATLSTLGVFVLTTLSFLTLCSRETEIIEVSKADYLYLAEDARIPTTILEPAPAAGDSSYTDPPGFNWPPEKGSVAFILEMSRDPGFGESRELLRKAKSQGSLIPQSETVAPIVVQGRSGWVIARLAFPLHRPSFKLGSGTWYWRWRCAFAEDQISPPSGGRKFQVCDNALEYSVPPVERLLSRIPDRHPRLFLRPENLDSFRNLIKTSEPHKRIWERIEAYADSLINLPVMQEPPPFPDVNPRDIPFALFLSYYEQARKMGQVLDFLSFCYLVSGQRKWSDRARDWLMALTRWDVEGTSAVTYNDEVAMPILVNGSRAYDWIYDALTEKERESIRRMLIVRGEQLFYKVFIEFQGNLFIPPGEKWPFHVHPWWNHSVRMVNYLTQAAVTLYGEAKGPDRWLGYLIPVFTTFYPPWGGRDGGYSEGPCYWMMYFNYMLQSAYCLEKAMDLDIMKKDFYRNNGYYKIFVDPYFTRQHPFADTGVGEYWPADKMNLYRLATIYKNPYFRWRAEMSKPRELPVTETIIPTGVMSYFWLDEGPDRPTARPPLDLPPSRLFGDIGIVGFHENPADPDETFMLFKSSPFGSISHTYADQNSFYIQGFGEALAIQSGYYPPYGNNHHRNWVWQTRAHNSILVNGEGQISRSRTSRGRIVTFSPGSGLPGSLDYAAGDATQAYGDRLKKFVRHIYYERPHDFLLIDELVAPKPVSFDWLLHSLEKMEIDQANNTVTVKRGKARLTVQFLNPDKLTFSQTDQFSDPDPEGRPNQWHLTVSTAGKQEACVFMVKMKVWRVK